jgi:hypothetical protein
MVISRKILIFIVCTIVMTGIGCSSYDPVPVTECKKVVKHARKVLGKLAPKKSEMMEQCEAADDQARGCVMAAKKTGDLMQCSM